jgi:hypothetical protein
MSYCKQHCKQFANHRLHRHQLSSFNNRPSQWSVTLIADRRISPIMDSSLLIRRIGAFRTPITTRMVSSKGASCLIHTSFPERGDETPASFFRTATRRIMAFSSGTGLLSDNKE